MLKLNLNLCTNKMGCNKMMQTVNTPFYDRPCVVSDTHKECSLDRVWCQIRTRNAPSTLTGFMNISVLPFFSSDCSGTSALPSDWSPQHRCTWRQTAELQPTSRAKHGSNRARGQSSTRTLFWKMITLF